MPQICFGFFEKSYLSNDYFLHNKFSGAGASAGEGASSEQVEAVNVAKECLLAALKVDPKAAHVWANLADAYYMIGDHRSSSKCLEKVLMAH